MGGQQKLLQVSKPASVIDNDQEIDWIFIRVQNLLQFTNLKKRWEQWNENFSFMNSFKNVDSREISRYFNFLLSLSRYQLGSSEISCDN